jgi:hypothetical protein
MRENPCKRSKGLFLTGLVLCFLFASASPLPAQSTYGTINGKVLDASGAVLPNAKVTIKNLETGQLRETSSNEAGLFRVPGLPSGKYMVEASAPSFEKVQKGPIGIEMAADVAVDMTLKPAATQTTVTVTEEAPLIESTQSQLAKGVEALRIQELPGLNSLTGLALLQPGALNNQNGRPGSGFVINGGRSRSNYFTIDGANNNDQSLSIPRINLPSETLGEFRIITNNFSAEYGRNSSSYVSQITKSGSNEFHGIARWLWDGNGFNSLTTNQQRTFNAQKATGLSDYLALRKARSVNVDNVGLASIGGPIKKDHTFFFASYDRDWFRQTTAATTPSISPQAFANLQANQQYFAPNALNFLTKYFPVANDITSRGNISIAVPNGPTIAVPLQQISRLGVPYGNGYYRWLTKVDTKASSKDNISARYIIYNYNDPGSPTALPLNAVGQAQRDQAITINEVHVFRPSVVSEARATYSRRKINFPENMPPGVTITGFNSIGNANYPQFRTDNLFEFMDNLSIMKGKHSLKAGINVLRYRLDSFFAANTRGTTTYPSLADFLFDTNATYVKYVGEGMVNSRTTEASGFFQDSWRASSNLTLNLGLRYEYTGAPYGYFSNAKPDINNFGPRAGFAWNPKRDSRLLGKLSGNGMLVVRGGYSLAYDQVFQNVLLNVGKNYPRGVNYSTPVTSGARWYDPANLPVILSPEAYVKAGNDPNLIDVRLFSPNKRISQPYGQQYSLGIERQFGNNYVVKLYYVGTRGLKLIRETERNIGFTAAAINVNPPVYAAIMPTLKPMRDSRGNITQYRQDPTRGAIGVGDGIAQSTYHSMQATLDKRFTRNFRVEVNYTYACFINDSDDILGSTTNSTIPAVPWNYSVDRGRSGFDQPHRMVANYVYQFPSYKKGSGAWGRVIGGWELSGITTLASGTPYTIYNSYNAIGIIPSGALTALTSMQRATVNLSGQRPLPSSPSVGAKAYFVANPTNSGIIGNAGRNTERTGGNNNFDVAVVRNTKVFGERHTVQLRWELFNLFNRRNFTVIPTSTVTTSTNVDTFMNLGQTNVSGRTMQFMLRYMF